MARRNDLSIFNGSGRHRPYGRRRRGPDLRAVLLTGIALALGLAAWRLVPEMFEGARIPLRVLGVDGGLGGAVIVGPDGSTTSHENGTAALGFEAPATLTVSAPGYVGAFFEVEDIPIDGPIHLQMEPIVLTGRVMAPDGSGVAGASISLGDMSMTTEEFGGFEFVGALPGEISVTKSAWQPASAEWDGNTARMDVVIEPFVVRGLRVDGLAAGDEEKFGEILRMADLSTVNTLVLDTKDERGIVPYLSNVQEARDIGAVADRYDPREVVETAHERDLYTITRIVTFQDPVRAPARTEQALHNSETGGIWRTVQGLGWMDPTDRDAWEYPLDLAVEACEIGFDEIQFDYVRFPTDGDLSVVEYDIAADSELDRIGIVVEFLEEAGDRLHPLGCAVSADIFAIVLSVPDDQLLGQKPEDLSWAVDAVSPMIYPSHYGPGWLGFDRPADHPEQVIGNALDGGMAKFVGGAVLRPWLQGFGYSPDQIEISIDEAEERGLGWMLWHASSDHSRESLPVE